MRKNLLLALLLLSTALGAFLLVVLSPRPSAFTPSIARFYSLGTFLHFQVWGARAPGALEAAKAFVADVDRRFSRYSSSSDTRILAQAAGKEEISLSGESLFLFSQALEYARLTEGAFDPTIGPLTALWNIGTPEEQLPSPEAIRKALKLVNYEDLLVFPQRGTALLAREGQLPDFGGIAKGYAGDGVRKILEEHGISQGLLDLGGNIVALGNKPGGAPWKIGIQNPLEPRGNYLGILSVSDTSVVTSGNYERYFEKEGKRYHHILDPRTGYPASQNLLSVTVTSESALQGDALSTGLYVLGLSRGMELAKKLEAVEALFVTSDRRVIATSGIARHFILTEESFSLEIR
ncbi:MAG TPA: FAD:protein FMN transferase [Synergistaceae bacterium]|nr:FAD:protein FMN transferase [Synergistaceae bacterium]HPJ25627.1 FAD:protein FMN transferase [Synergistaceae bacterium]HPQ37702.1 FAD:protein FMN transferase [Synergistaceae bacterium]